MVDWLLFSFYHTPPSLFLCCLILEMNLWRKRSWSKGQWQSYHHIVRICLINVEFQCLETVLSLGTGEIFMEKLASYYSPRNFQLFPMTAMRFICFIFISVVQVEVSVVYPIHDENYSRRARSDYWPCSSHRGLPKAMIGQWTAKSWIRVLRKVKPGVHTVIYFQTTIPAKHGHCEQSHRKWILCYVNSTLIKNSF